MQVVISYDSWTQIGTAGKNICVWLDEQDDAAAGHADCRVVASVDEPLLSDITKGKRVYKPSKNNDVLTLSATPEEMSFWARCANEGDSVTLNVEYVGYSETFVKDVFIQDQHSYLVEAFFAQELNPFTFAADANAGDTSVTVNSGHNFTTATGQLLVVKGYYEGRVISVVGNVIGLDMPLNIPISSGAIGYRANSSLLVDGSSTPVIFKMASISGRKFDIKGVRLTFRGVSVMDYTKFGSATALTYPLVFRKKISDVRYNNVCAARTNKELENVFDLTLSDKAPSGEYGMLAEYKASVERGVVFRLSGDNEELQFVVRGNLSTGNTAIEAMAYGHVVED